MWETKKWVLICGLLTLFLGSAILIFQTTIFSYILGMFMKLNENSYLYEFWRKVPMEIPTTFFFFNWTNHEEFLKKNVKPKFEEIGPYQFLQNFEKIDIVHNDNNTITFREIRDYKYNNNFENNGNLSDKIITINYMLMFLSYHVKYWNEFFKDSLMQLISIFDQDYYFETTANEETYAGNNHPVMELINYLDFISPEFLRTDHFGWLSLRKGDPTFDGVFNVINGANRQYDILNWNYENSTRYFKEPCNKIQGSTGEVHSYSEKRDYLDVFAPEICRYIRLYFEEEVMVNNLLGHKFSASKDTVDNGTMYPENKCFNDEGNLPSGLLNLSSCRYDLNLFVSFPHFYGADETYLNAVEGLNPNKSVHEGYIIIEPITGICLDFRLRAQLNVLTYFIDGIGDYDSFPEIYFPLFWIEQAAQIPESIVTFLKNFLYLPYVILAVGIVLTTVGLCLTGCTVYKIIEPYRIKNSCTSNKALNVILESVPLNQNKDVC